MAPPLPYWLLSQPSISSAVLLAFLLLLLLAALSWILVQFPFPPPPERKKNTSQNGGDDELPLPPGSMGLPVLGETLAFLRTQRKNRSWEFVEERVRKYGGTFKTSLVGFRTVVVASPAGNKMAFSNIHMSWPYSVNVVVGSQSLLAQTGKNATRLRNALHAFLNPEALSRYTALVSQIVQNSLHPHHTIPSSDSHGHGHHQLLVLYPFMQYLAFSIVCHVLFGIHDPLHQRSMFHNVSTLMRGILQLPINFPGTRYRHALATSRAMKLKLQSLIHMKRAEIAASAGATSVQQQHTVDVLSGLLAFKDEDGHPLSDQEIKDNLLLLVVAGHDTTSVVTTMVCRYLALHPSIMDDVYKENKAVAEGLRREGGGDEPLLLRWEDLQKLKLTWRVVQETMRLQPAAQGGFRIATEDMSFDGYKIPKSWKIYWSVNSTMRNPKYFPEPHKFDPSRFEGAGPAPYTFMPFGGGPRMCPGNEFARMEMLIIIHYMVTNFSWTLKDPEERITVDPIPIPVKGLPVLLRPRADGSISGYVSSS